MFERLTSFLKAVFASTVLALHTAVLFTTLIPFALVKLLVPIKPVRRAMTYMVNKHGDAWVGMNCLWMQAVGHTRWDVRGMGQLKQRGWYLVASNHQSWVDILVLQKVFGGRIPLLKFFLKKELIYVPIMGLAWWALDFPFMTRKGKASAAKDLETARKACEKFRDLPTSVMSFLEGTRYTKAKHDQQQSPYRHLLKPKTGGIGMALATMGELFDGMLDVTIVYPERVPTFTDVLCGRLHHVIIDIKQIAIPAELKSGNVGDPQYRSHLQSWINHLWAEKDRYIDELTSAQRRAA